MAGRESFEIALGAVRIDPLEAEDELTKLMAKGPSEGYEEREARAGNPEPWIVQFHSALAANVIARLRAQFGLRLTEYVPNLAYVEQLTPAKVAALRDDPLVRAAIAYRPEFKLAPNLDVAGRMPRETEESGERPVRLLLFDYAELERATADLVRTGLFDLRVLDDRPFGGMVHVLATAPNKNSITAAAELPEVRWIEPITRFVTNNVGAAATIQSGDASNPEIWGKGLHGEKQVVGIIDNGPPDIKHCFFRDSKNDNQLGPTHRKILDLRNARITSTGAHATFVAGCLAGDDLENLGAAPRRGGAWKAKLVVGNLNDLAAFTDFAEAKTLFHELKAARDVGATIHSNSFTEHVGNPPMYSTMAAEVDQFTWTYEDQLVLGSAGTNGELGGAPGTAKNAICVAAAQADPNELTVCDGGHGPTLDGRRKPDLVAVGSGIKSAEFHTACGTGFYLGEDSCATSFATPHAAAAAALVRQYFTEGWYPTGKKESGHALTPAGALLKAVLLACTIDMNGPGYPNDIEGFGLVQLRRGLYFADTGSPMRLKVYDVRHAKGLTTGQSTSRRIEVTAPVQPLKIVLVYSDAPSEPGTGAGTGGLVNDLNLVVTGPDGAKFLGNHFVNDESAVGGAADHRNNVEVVLLPTPQVGTYTITVVGERVSRGNPGQGFAVAVLGSLSSLDIGGCFVASAVYGNSEHPDVQALRDWRDTHLAPGAPGRAAMMALVRAYALLGPPMARLVGAHPCLAKLVRERMLAPFVAWLNGKANRRCF